jgi:hypothetical protein
MKISPGSRRKTAAADSMDCWCDSGFGAGKAVFLLFKKRPREIAGGVRRILWARVFRMGDLGPKAATGSLLRLLR